ncbi:MAG: response regulator [Ignavibacteriales bacterium]|nr:response regulator [Ignavibacteriales bacterium]
MATLLLVEDNDVNREMLVRRLQRRGFTMLEAVDGQDAIDKTIASKPDLVLMDMSLPVLDGWEATKQLRSNPEVSGIPIIALTAHAMVGDRQKVIAAGCTDYATKPIDFERLLAMINTYVK